MTHKHSSRGRHAVFGIAVAAAAYVAIGLYARARDKAKNGVAGIGLGGYLANPSWIVNAVRP